MSINHKKIISGRSNIHNIVRHGLNIDSKLTNDGKSILHLTNNPNSSVGIGLDIDNIFSKISFGNTKNNRIPMNFAFSENADGTDFLGFGYFMDINDNSTYTTGTITQLTSRFYTGNAHGIGFFTYDENPRATIDKDKQINISDEVNSFKQASMFLDNNGKLTINAQYYEDYKGVDNNRFPKIASEKNVTFPIALDLGGGILMHKGRGIIFNDIFTEFSTDQYPPNLQVPPQTLYFHSKINPLTGSMKDGLGGFAYKDISGNTRIITAIPYSNSSDNVNAKIDRLTKELDDLKTKLTQLGLNLT